MATQLITVYLDCPIYYVTPPDVSSAIFRSPCIVGDYVKLSAAKKRICQGQGGTWDGTSCTFEEPPEPPPPEEDHLEEVYHEVEIWHLVSLNLFRAYVAPGYIATGLTLPDIRVSIDEILEFLEPPEDPEDGLFAQIIAAIQTWIMTLIPGWVMEWGENIYTTINNIVENITNVYNDLREYVTNVYNNVYETIQNTYNTFREYITNVYNYVTEEITNIYNNTYNYFTEVIGVTAEWVDQKLTENREWMENFAILMDPQGFLNDPIGFINAAFELQGEIADTEMIESFLAGLEEGLTEEVEE